MLLKSVTAVAFLVAASQAVAEPMPYKPTKMMMSAREIFGLARRQADGYQPTQTYCGMGSTCAEACGAGFDTCPSTDNAIHCYNPVVKQICCSDGTGNSCDVGFYCAGTTGGETLCCPDGQSVDACAKAYGVTGSLSSEAPKPTSYSSSSSTSAYPYSIAHNSTTVMPTSYTTSSYKSIMTPAATYPASNTTTKGVSSTPTPVTVNGGNIARPAGAVLALAAAAIAALL